MQNEFNVAAIFTEYQLQVLKNAYAAGVLEVTYDDGNKAVFDSEKALMKRIKFIERELYGSNDNRVATAKLTR